MVQFCILNFSFVVFVYALIVPYSPFFHLMLGEAKCLLFFFFFFFFLICSTVC